MRVAASGPGWRAFVAVFVLLLVYDGAARKWLFPGFEQAIFVLKDVLLFAAVVAVFITPNRAVCASVHPASRTIMALYAAWVGLEMWNPNLPNALVGLWGAKAHLLYAGLIVLLPLAFRDLNHLFSAIERAFPWLVVPVVVLALIQLQAPGFSALNQNVRGGMDSVAYFGDSGLVRVSGTFSYLSGMAAFVEISALLGIALFFCGARSRGFLVGLAFALLAVPVTGSRAVVVVLAVGVAILLCGALACRLISGRYAFLVALTLAVLLAASLQSQEAAWEALSQRAEGGSRDEGRAVTAFTNAFAYFDVAGATGFGAGAANLGAPALAPDVPPYSWLPFGEAFEEESGRIVAELGVLGWALSLAMRATFLYWATRLALWGRTITARSGGLVALPMVALGLYQGNGVFSAPLASAYYWFCIAVLSMAQWDHQQGTRPVPARGRYLPYQARAE